jgi:VIT1/CCC1 family predicted Fe2+/Mn2+ transporter
MFGLIMVIVVTNTVQIALPKSEADLRIMTFAALGSITAWGIADGIMYIVTSIFERNRDLKLISTILSAGKKDEAIAAVEEEFESTILWTLDAKVRRRISREVLKSTSTVTVEKASITKQDLLGGFSSFILVFSSAFPATIPFLVLGNLFTATQLSNVIAIAALFFVGYEWGGHTGQSGIRSGLATVTIGLIIVVIAIVLGG